MAGADDIIGGGSTSRVNNTLDNNFLQPKHDPAIIKNKKPIVYSRKERSSTLISLFDHQPCVSTHSYSHTTCLQAWGPWGARLQCTLYKPRLTITAGFFSGLGDAANKTVSGVTGTVGTAVGGVGKTVGGATEGLGKTISGVSEGVGNTAKGVGQSTGGALGSLGGKQSKEGEGSSSSRT